MGVLKLIGQGIEEPEIIEKLLDVNYFKERPGYPLASPNNLVLYDCKYKDVDFNIPEGANKVFLENFIFDLYNQQVLRLKLITSIAQNYKESILKDSNVQIKKIFKKKLKKRTTIEVAYKNHIIGKKNKMMTPAELQKQKEINKNRKIISKNKKK
jgi:hypothetical protein